MSNCTTANTTGRPRWLLLLSTVLPLAALCQQASDSSTALHDTSYYHTYEGMLTGRVYSSNKYLLMDVRPEAKGGSPLAYRPNTPNTFGVGATYDWFTLNLAYGFPFLNQYKRDRGNTRYLDLQSHAYGRRATIDFYGQFYRGFYLKPANGGPIETLRPDLGMTQLGLQYEYMLNWRRFSMRAGLLQSERQLKSAGTVLLGMGMHYNVSRADSSLTESRTAVPNGPSVRRFRSVEIGPSVGYAYTLVLWQRFFVTGAGTVSFNVGQVKASSATQALYHWGLRPDWGFKLAVGFNRPRWTGAATWVAQRFNYQSADYDLRFAGGQVRLLLAYRFTPGPRTKKLLRPIDRLNEQLTAAIRRRMGKRKQAP